MQTLVERGCGLDVHQATVVACLLIVLKKGKVQKPVRTYKRAAVAIAHKILVAIYHNAFPASLLQRPREISTWTSSTNTTSRET